ncbi:MAG: chemotaxis protein [Porticoccaceae bacterium]|nr:MAG: chemotaxis protein [Porticoccaceae bacterium]
MEQSAPQPTPLPDRVACLSLPLAETTLLVPVTAVAEVTTHGTVAGPAEGFCYGTFDWRTLRIPLISFEAFAGRPRPDLSGEGRVAVVNAVGAAAGVGFYGLRLQGLPSPLQVGEADCRGARKPDVRGVVAALSLAGRECWLPDLEALEAALAALT